MTDAISLEDRILQLLADEDMPAALIARSIGRRLERVYEILVRMESEGKVKVWARDWPRARLWCIA